MGLAVIVGAVVVVWLLPWVLTAGDATVLAPADRLKAQNDVRTALIALLVAVGTGVTVTYTVRTYVLNRERQVTDSFSTAVGHLGDDESASVRVGGLYALGRLGQDVERDRESIIHVIGTFVRESSRTMRDDQNAVPQDVVAALRVLSRLLVLSPTATVDLRGADLDGADLSGLPLERVGLTDDPMRGTTR